MSSLKSSVLSNATFVLLLLVCVLHSIESFSASHIPTVTRHSALQNRLNYYACSVTSLGAAPSFNDNSSAAANAESNTWRSAIQTIASKDKQAALDAVTDLCTSTPCRSPSPGESGLAFLFVSQPHADHFADIVRAAHETLGDDTTLLSVVGAGVVGAGEESDDPSVPAISLLCGVLPASASTEVFMFGPDEAPPPASSKAWQAIGRNQDVPSYVMFADPWAPIQPVLDGLDGSGVQGAVVAGGISCPVFGEDMPTVAINGKAYPRGTAVGVGLSGTIGLQAVVAQGCRPIGPAFGVTKAEGNIIVELDSNPAMVELQKMTNGEYSSKEDAALIRRNGILCGLAAPGSSDIETGDYLIREIIGFRSPSIVIGTEVKEGDVFRFHVRDSAAAKDDFQQMVGRAKTERIFAGPEKSGVPLAALQVSCVARGRSLFGDTNVDVANVQNLVGQQGDEDAAVGGFFANGEIGPVGVSGVGLTARQTHMHGFTTVAATICDFSPRDQTSPATSSEVSALDEEGEDISAWG